jgi:hypothetical protein
LAIFLFRGVALAEAMFSSWVEATLEPCFDSKTVLIDS